MRFCRDSCEEVPCFTPGGGGGSVPSGLKGGLADDSGGSEETRSKHT